MASPPIPTSDPKPTTEKKPAAPEPPAVEQPGKATAIGETMRFEVDALAHTAVAQILAEISGRIRKAVAAPSHVVFLDDELTAALSNRRAFLQQVRVLKEAFNSAEKLAQEGLDRLPQQPGKGAGASAMVVVPVLTATAGAVSAVANLIGFFRHETSFHGRKAEISETALAAELARNFSSGDITFHWPALGIAPGAFAQDPGQPRFVKDLSELSQAHDRAANRIHTLATAIKNIEGDDQKLGEARLSLDRANQQFSSAATVLDNLRKELATADPNSGLTLMNLLQRASDIIALLPGAAAAPSAPGPGLAIPGGTPASSEEPPKDPPSGRPVYFLSTKVEAAGGSYRVHRSLWSNLSSDDDGLAFSGGAIVSFVLTDSEGKILASGTLPLRLAFRSFTQEQTTFDHPAWTKKD